MFSPGMSLPGSGLLASLRGNFSGGERSGPSDDAKFEARSSAVLAVEHAVASGAVGHPGRKVPRGCFVETVDGEFTYRLDEAHPGEDHVELTVCCSSILLETIRAGSVSLNSL